MKKLDSKTNILLCGASGFVGSAIRRALQRYNNSRFLFRKKPDDPEIAKSTILADITDPESLKGCCDGIDTIIHAASAISSSEITCLNVNLYGTQNLLKEARKAGVSRIIYLSTAAVYGEGIHSNIYEDEIEPVPVSATSRTRRLAEIEILTFGGTVLRPFLMYGTGDRWFIPSLIKFQRNYPIYIEGGSAKLSLLSVDDLAENVVTLALDPQNIDREKIYHVAPKKTTTTAEVIETLYNFKFIPYPSRDLNYTQTLNMIKSLDPTIARQISLISFDHDYNGSALRYRTGISPLNFIERFGDYANTYNKSLSQ